MPEENDPLICTYVLESPELSGGYTVEEASGMAASLANNWLTSALQAYPPELDLWLASGYRKHLRRAKTKDFDRLLEATENPLLVEGTEGRLLALPLSRRTETSKLVSKLQLSGFRQADRPSNQHLGPVDLVLNKELGMSFGKSVIAAAHASQNLYLKLLTSNPAAFKNWQLHGFGAKVAIGSITPTSVTYAQVEDYGLTEVPAGSITALAQLR